LAAALVAGLELRSRFGANWIQKKAPDN